ncbi:MAG: hypothetical protein N3A54_04570 [Patescibacteria group bacterium]|nr:hypothetical protein [Patescibacteria group bacterium]
MRKPDSIPKNLPQEFHRFFWDVDPNTINPAISKEYVIARLLDKGNLESARWILQTFDTKTIITVIKKHKNFAPLNAAFWANYFGIPREEVACLDPRFMQMRKKLWPFSAV